MFNSAKFFYLTLAVSIYPFILDAADPNSVSNVWAPLGASHQARSGACTATMSDGRVSVTGGMNRSAVLASTEILEADGRFSTAAPMNAARSRHACVGLVDGTVLVVGG